MSTWGGIGEGISQGLSDRMARDDQMRRERQAQANADRAFQFQQEQANRAQSNADRAFEAGREDAANAQSNAERKMEMERANADREYVMKLDELQLRADAASANIDAQDARLSMERESHDWDNQIKSEKLRSFQMANDKLDAERRKRMEMERLSADAAAKQWVFATARLMNGTSGRDEVWEVEDRPGVVTKVNGRIVDGDEFYGIFGKDGDLVKQGFYGVAMTRDENGSPMFTLLNSNPKMDVVKDEDAMYETYKGEYGEDFAKQHFGKAKDRRDLGMFTAKEDARAMASAKAATASDPYGVKRKIDAATAILRDQFSSVEDRKAATEFLMSQIGTGAPAAGNGEWAGFSAEKRAYLEKNGYVWDAASGKPVRKQPNPKARLVVPAK